MKDTIIKILLELLLKLMSPELLRIVADKLLDLVESYVKTSPGTMDDKIVLPICAAIREAFNIPDND